MNATKRLKAYAVVGFQIIITLIAVAAVITAIAVASSGNGWDAIGLLVGIGWPAAVYALWHYRDRWRSLVRPQT